MNYPIPNSNAVQSTVVTVWRQTPIIWFSLVVALALLVIAFRDSLTYMVEMWDAKEEYSYGYIVPFMTLFLIWQRRPLIERSTYEGAWSGVVVLASSFALFVIGELSSLYTIQQYAFVIAVVGLLLSLMGWSAFRLVAMAVLMLAFMIPMPEFILKSASGQLQLISSEIGVAVIRAFGISVSLEGNVIDLGAMKLQVVDACSGLRYLFPLMTFGFITAIFYKAELWKRVMIFLSTIPITIFMNSFRIGLIGVTVDYWGPAMAEGFLHDFEGWAVFMACTGILFAEMWLLTFFGSNRRPLHSTFRIDWPVSAPSSAKIYFRAFPKPFAISGLVVCLIVISAFSLPARTEFVPARTSFIDFPLTLGGWHGVQGRVEQMYLDVLKVDDYFIADYADGAGQSINLYMSYYESQRKGQSAHSPKTCIPGGGWQIGDFSSLEIDGGLGEGAALNVNRAIIRKGDSQQLVYYWFAQRGRSITNEYLVKWFLFWDSLVKNRTDGALVRLVAPITSKGDVATADAKMQLFVRTIAKQLPRYIPE